VRVVLPSDRGAKQDKDAIAANLIDGAVVRHDDIDHRFQIVIEEGKGLLRR
jgi:hypothetical protein